MKVNDRHCSFYYEKEPIEGKISFNKSTTALLIIDMQNVFVERPNSYDNEDERIRWKPFYDEIEDVVIPNNELLLKEFREQDLVVTHARIVCQRSDGKDRSLSQKESGFNNLLLPKGSHEAKIIEELEPLEDEIVFEKTTDSAVTGTNLRLLFANMGITDVVVTGVFTDQCVSGTVRSLADESFKVWLIEDATNSATEELKNNELRILNNIYCNVINTEELLEVLKG